MVYTTEILTKAFIWSNISSKDEPIGAGGAPISCTPLKYKL